MKNLYFLLLVIIGTTHFAYGQTANQYFFKTKTGVALEDMSLGGAPILGTAIDGVNSRSIAFFPFTFAGKSFNNFSVSDNGVVVLGDASYYPYAYDNYFDQTPALVGQSTAYPVLLPWGEDLYTADNGSVSYKITGTAPARKLIIEFKVNSVEDNATEYNKTFQVWLFEGSNQIQYVYGDMHVDWYNSANIGIASSGVDYLSVDGTTNSVSSTSVASNSGSYLPLVMPALPNKGTSYIFSPSTIVETNPTPEPTPATPMAASVTVFPQYCVPGQNKYTIYLGYGLQSVILTTNASGGNPSKAGYTYSWSPATGLSNATVALPIANPKVTTTYTVTITDGNGNSINKTVTVYVIDVRCGDKGDKVKVCKPEKDRNKEECVAVKDVAERLKKGQTLGSCNIAAATSTVARIASASNSSLLMEMDSETTGSAVLYPNPSVGTFNVQLAESENSTTITVYDVSGRVAAQKVAGEHQRIVQFDLTGKARGIYLVKMISKEDVRTSKIMIQ